MPHFVFINGLPASGKTACSTLLYQKLQKAAYIEGDSLTNVGAFINDEQLSVLKIENAAALTSNFLKNGCEYIVFDGLVWSQQELDVLLKKFEGKLFEMTIFLLQSDFKSRQMRYPSPQKLEEIDEKLSTVVNITSPLGQIHAIDTGERLPDEITEEMKQIIKPPAP